MIRLRRSDAAFVGLAVAGIAGVVLNPFLTTIWEQQWAALGVVALVVLAAVGLEVARSQQRAPSMPEEDFDRPNAPGSRAMLGIGIAATAAAWAWLYQPWWKDPRLYADDYRYIRQSADWETTRRHLFVPFNEHLAPATRVVTWLLLRLDGEHPERAFAAFSIVMLVVTTDLLFRLAWRIGGDFAGLAAATWFAVSSCHSEVVTWYSASQWLIAACLLLGSLLAVERASLGGLSLSTLFSALAPWSYSIGVLVGPFTSFWLWTWHGRRGWRSLLPFAMGLASTAAALVIVRRSMHDADYWKWGGRGMLEAFDPVQGFLFSVRLAVDRLLPTDLLLPWSNMATVRSTAVAALLGVTVVAALRRAPRLAQLWPIAVLIVLGYAVTIPFRAWQSYAGLVGWNRYQLIPQLGMSLLVAGLVGNSPRLRDRVDGKKLGWFLAGLLLWTGVQAEAVLYLIR